MNARKIIRDANIPEKFHQLILNKLEIMKDYEKRELLEAIKTEPTGIFCATCKELNFNFDDCGFWYSEGEGGYKARCDNCDLAPHNGER